MKKNPFQHIDLRVNDMEKAWSFYSKILPAMCFAKGWKVENFDVLRGVLRGSFRQLSRDLLSRGLITACLGRPTRSGRIG